MDDIRVGSKGPLAPLPEREKTKANLSGGFEELLKDAMGKIQEIQKDTETAVKELAQGGDVTQAIIALEKADMSFQLMVEIRNRLLNAYDEIMRMQV